MQFNISRMTIKLIIRLVHGFVKLNGGRDAEYCVGGGPSKVGQKKQVVAHPVKLTKSPRVPDVDNYLPPIFF